MKAIHLLPAVAALAIAAASAQQVPPAADHGANHPANAASAAAPQSEGEVRKVDLAQGKVTLRHGPLANLDMPAMTMVFTAADKQLLQGVKAGDQVRFTADSKDGTLVVTALKVVR